MHFYLEERARRRATHSRGNFVIAMLGLLLRLIVIQIAFTARLIPRVFRISVSDSDSETKNISWSECGS